MVTVNQLLFSELWRVGAIHQQPSADMQEWRQSLLRSAAEAETLATRAPTARYHDACKVIAKFWRDMAEDATTKD